MRSHCFHSWFFGWVFAIGIGFSLQSYAGTEPFSGMDPKECPNATLPWVNYIDGEITPYLTPGCNPSGQTKYFALINHTLNLVTADGGGDTSYDNLYPSEMSTPTPQTYLLFPDISYFNLSAKTYAALSSDEQETIYKSLQPLIVHNHMSSVLNFIHKVLMENEPGIPIYVIPNSLGPGYLGWNDGNGIIKTGSFQTNFAELTTLPHDISNLAHEILHTIDAKYAEPKGYVDLSGYCKGGELQLATGVEEGMADAFGKAVEAALKPWGKLWGPIIVTSPEKILTYENFMGQFSKLDKNVSDCNAHFYGQFIITLLSNTRRGIALQDGNSYTFLTTPVHPTKISYLLLHTIKYGYSWRNSLPDAANATLQACFDSVGTKLGDGNTISINDCAQLEEVINLFGLNPPGTKGTSAKAAPIIYDFGLAVKPEVTHDTTEIAPKPGVLATSHYSFKVHNYSQSTWDGPFQVLVYPSDKIPSPETLVYSRMHVYLIEPNYQKTQTFTLDFTKVSELTSPPINYIVDVQPALPLGYTVNKISLPDQGTITVGADYQLDSIEVTSKPVYGPKTLIINPLGIDNKSPRPYTLSLTITNKGTRPVKAELPIQITQDGPLPASGKSNTFSTDAKIYDPKKNPLTKPEPIKSKVPTSGIVNIVAPDQKFTVAQTITSKPGQSLKIVLDPDNTITELNEDNNIFSFTLPQSPFPQKITTIAPSLALPTRAVLRPPPLRMNDLLPPEHPSLQKKGGQFDYD